jgi:hypothetical protein
MDVDGVRPVAGVIDQLPQFDRAARRFSDDTIVDVAKSYAVDFPFAISKKFSIWSAGGVPAVDLLVPKGEDVVWLVQVFLWQKR